VTGLTAPLVIDGAMTGERFEAYAEQVLVPRLSPGAIVVLDNLAAHRRAGARRAIKAAACFVRYRPASSPDLNPLELAFSTLTRLLRKAAARTVEALGDAIGRLLDCFSPEECANDIRHAGYPATGSRTAL
jgi:transposase